MKNSPTSTAIGKACAFVRDNDSPDHCPNPPKSIDDGRVEMDTNAVENGIRKIVLTRKNALFAGHDEGGRAWGIIASLIGTAKLNNIEPFGYLQHTLEAIAKGHPQNRIDELLPWNFAPASS